MGLTALVENGILIELSFFFFLLPCKTTNNYGGHAAEMGKGSLLECILRSGPAGGPAEVCVITAQGVPA